MFVLSPLLFARHLFDWRPILDAMLAFVAFCLLSSAVYIFNDLLDVELDRAHPLKAKRPLAARRIQPRQAVIAGVVLALIALALAFSERLWFGAVVTSYLVLNLLYSYWWKNLAFLDVGIIATGFVLRVVGGALAIDVGFSTWLVVCTFCLACLLAFGKRHHELITLPAFTAPARPALAGYTLASLRLSERLFAGITVATYVWYTVAPGTVAKFQTYQLVLTLPFPVIGILRYLFLVETEQRKSPTEAVVTDVPTLVNLACWVIGVGLILYHGL